MDVAAFFRQLQGGGSSKRSRRSRRSGGSGRGGLFASPILFAGRTLHLESLETRALLTTFYVDNNLLVAADRDHSGGLSAGDQVTFGNGQSYQQADLTYDAAPVDGDVGTAFSSIGQALSSSLVQPGDTIEIAGGTYTEGGLTIDENLTLEGEGNVVIAAPQNASQPGLSIIDQPDRVTIKNLSVQGFQTSLSDTGGGTLTLVDVGLIDGETSISDLDNLDVVSDSTASNTVIIDIVRYVQLFTPLAAGVAAPSSNGSETPGDVPDNIWIPGMLSVTFSGVQNLSFATGAGVQDTIGVSPLPDTTVTIDGDDSNSPEEPGDTLEMPTNFSPGSSLTATQDATGLSGTWTVSGSQPVNFSHIASLSPGIGTQTVAPITGTQGVDTGSQVVAQFTDPVGDPLAAGDTAPIYWGDNSTSAGTMTYDASTGVYSVLGSHTYTEGGTFTINVELDTPGSTVLLPAATANIAATTVPQLSPVQQWTLMPTVGQSTANMDLVTYSDSVHLPPSDYSAEISWGDGATTSGTITTGSGTFTVFGDHAYAQPGIDEIVVTVLRNGVVAGTLTATAYVSDQPLTDTPVTLSGPAGVALGGSSGALLATFEEPLTDTGDFQATIDWGDGSTSPGTVVEQGLTPSDPDDRLSWQVYGSHTYQQPGTYDVRVSLTQYLSPTETANAVSWLDSAATITASSTAAPIVVGEPPFTALSETLTGTAGATLGSGAGPLVAIITDPTDDTQTYQATIDWGDGTTTSGTVSRSGLVVANIPSYVPLDVFGNHTYAQPGTYEIHVSLTDAGNNIASVISTAIIAGNQGTGNQGTGNQGTGNQGTGNQGTGNQDAETADQAFVTNVYHDLLNRPVDPAALAYWSGQLDAGLARSQFVSDIEASGEYRDDVVLSLYEKYLQRAAEPAALAADSQLLAQGGTDEQLAMMLVSSDEYYALHGGTADGFLSGLFQDALGRPIDAATKTTFEAALAGGTSRAQLAAVVFGSQEHHSEVVESVYADLLNRPADSAGDSYWAAQLGDGLTDEELIVLIASSAEYFGK